MKPLTKSKTIKVGGLYVASGVLVAILQMINQLETMLASINMQDLPPGLAVWGGIILAIIGGIQIWLRMVTSKPIGKPESD
jgi:hypothetical protein